MKGFIFFSFLAICVIARLYFLYIKYKKKFHSSFVWKIIWDLKDSDDKINLLSTEKIFYTIMDCCERGKVSKSEIQIIRNTLFYIIDDKLSHRIKSSMNIENPALPSLREIFPVGYTRFPFDEIYKKENFFLLIDEFEKIRSLIEPSHEVSSKFVRKLNSNILDILYGIKKYLDLNGRISPEGVLMRYNYFIRTIKRIPLVDVNILVPLINELENGRNNAEKFFNKKKYA